MTTRYLGAPVARNEDRRLLTGRALFVNDVERPGMLHVAFLRSPTPMPGWVRSNCRVFENGLA
jgi:CO/xanthine dehydrogenase Mo-binding subunit